MGAGGGADLDAAATVEAIVGPLTARGGAAYLGEPVTQLEHALQAADLAAAGGAVPALVAAALLHDVGWLLGREDTAGHAERSAEHLGRWLPPAVTGPVRLHVSAKRWLCATSPAYHDLLSEASRRTLVAQGGPMDAGERRVFEADPYAADAIALRRWDDEAKAPGRAVPGLDEWRPLLTRLVADGAAAR